MRKLFVRPQARLDLLEVWHQIAADSPSTADKVFQRIESEIRDLMEMPGKGHWRSDVRDVRYGFWTVYSYVVAYRYDETTSTVVRVIHGRRDFRKLFKRQP
jgi:toxin ParE1/3/4